MARLALPSLAALALLAAGVVAPAAQAQMPYIPPVPTVPTVPTVPGVPTIPGVKKGTQVTTTIGIADQHGETFGDPLFTALGVHNARLNLAWDALDYDWQVVELDKWMAQAQAAGVAPLVIFSQSRVQGRTRMLPTPAEFSAVVDKLRARYPFVHDFAAWNEANHAGQPTYGRPDMVARYYKVLRTKCLGCNVLPASLLDNPNLVPWTLKLRKAIIKLGQPEPRLWGLHNYSDVNRLKDKSTRALLAAVKGKVWITESGGVVAATSPTASKFPQGAGYAAKVTKYILGPLIKANPRIERVYFYNWKADGPDVSWDSGIVSPEGVPRAAYQVLKNTLQGGVVRNQALPVKKVKADRRKLKVNKRQQKATRRGQRNKRR